MSGKGFEPSRDRYTVTIPYPWEWEDTYSAWLRLLAKTIEEADAYYGGSPKWREAR